jgi:hypothetical protein
MGEYCCFWKACCAGGELNVGWGEGRGCWGEEEGVGLAQQLAEVYEPFFTLGTFVKTDHSFQKGKVFATNISLIMCILNLRDYSFNYINII